MSNEDAIDIGLVLTTTAYSFWLDKHKHAEPDWTWAEVVFGVGIVLTAAGLRTRAQGRPDLHETNVWRAFLLGGTPIICGEISQALRGWQARDAYRKRQWESEDERTPALADWGRRTPRNGA